MVISKKLSFVFLIGLFSIFSVEADNNLPVLPPLPPILDEISFQVAAEQWVNTTTALVTVTVNAVLDTKGLIDIHQQVADNLAHFSKAASWHVTQFNRTHDQSGLEQVTIQAQARLPQNELANLRTEAKAISKPGETYTISDVVYTPSLAEIEAASLQLRNQLYAQINDELKVLHQAYPKQNFQIYRLNFIPTNYQPPASPRMMVLAKVSQADTSSEFGLPVGNQLILTANVVLAAPRVG